MRESAAISAQVSVCPISAATAGACCTNPVRTAVRPAVAAFRTTMPLLPVIAGLITDIPRDPLTWVNARDQGADLL